MCLTDSHMHLNPQLNYVEYFACMQNCPIANCDTELVHLIKELHLVMSLYMVYDIKGVHDLLVNKTSLRQLVDSNNYFARGLQQLVMAMVFFLLIF